MPNKYPLEVRQRATRMALERLPDYPSPWPARRDLGENPLTWDVYVPTWSPPRPGACVSHSRSIRSRGRSWAGRYQR